MDAPLVRVLVVLGKASMVPCATNRDGVLEGFRALSTHHKGGRHLQADAPCSRPPLSAVTIPPRSAGPRMIATGCTHHTQPPGPPRAVEKGTGEQARRSNQSRQFPDPA
jgi:hypothetical protein